MGNKVLLTDKDIEVLEQAVWWFSTAAAYCDDFEVQKIKGFDDEYWKMDDVLFAFEMFVDRFTGGDKKRIQETLKNLTKSKKV